MLSARERVRRTLTFQQPDRAPRDLWALPGVEMFRQPELEALRQRFPVDLARADMTYGPSPRARGTPNVVGTYTDDWGCGFTVAAPGVIGEVKAAPLADWAALARFRPPYEILDTADFSRVNAACAATDRFVLSNAKIQPFERMQFLRGTENLLMDLAAGDARLDRLRDMVHEFFMADLARWAQTDVDAIRFVDDWGAQDRLLIAPRLWRAFYKPLYADYCRAIHAAGKFVFFHSDGYILAILPDLIEIGVDAINCQLFCMPIEEIGRRFRGQITFWGEIDRQHILPFGTVADVQAAVRRVRRALDDGRGGVIAQCEWGNADPTANIAAVFETWLEPLAVARAPEGARTAS